MPKIDITAIPVQAKTDYPGDLAKVVAGRERQRLGDAGGLTQYGVNLTRLKPGAASALRHWHESEDEFVYVLEGELVLVEDGGETVLGPGDAATFKAGVADGHHLINRSDRDAVLLEIGSRAAADVVHYPDVDLHYVRDTGGKRLTRKSGEPYRDRPHER